VVGEKKDGERGRPRHREAAAAPAMGRGRRRSGDREGLREGDKGEREPAGEAQRHGLGGAAAAVVRRLGGAE